MGRKLPYKTLILMDSQKVIVHDLAYDAYDQICEIKVIEQILLNKFTNKFQKVITGIILFNDEYTFEYDCYGKCVNGEFDVESLR